MGLDAYFSCQMKLVTQLVSSSWTSFSSLCHGFAKTRKLSNVFVFRGDLNPHVDAFQASPSPVLWGVSDCSKWGAIWALYPAGLSIGHRLNEINVQSLTGMAWEELPLWPRLTTTGLAVELLRAPKFRFYTRMVIYDSDTNPSVCH